jgi:hypothetical protein
MKGLSTIIYSITSTIAFLAFWYNVNSWYSDDTSLLAIIIAGIAANGAFFGNITLIIIEHNNEDMLLVRKFKKIFTSKN